MVSWTHKSGICYKTARKNSSMIGHQLALQSHSRSVLTKCPNKSSEILPESVLLEEK